MTRRRGAQPPIQRWENRHLKDLEELDRHRSWEDRFFDALLARHGRKKFCPARFAERPSTRLRADELLRGKLLVRIRRHLVAVIDHVIRDMTDCGGAGRVRVEGYWTAMSAAGEE